MKETSSKDPLHGITLEAVMNYEKEPPPRESKTGRQAPLYVALAFACVFSGWPSIGNFPLTVQIAQAAAPNLDTIYPTAYSSTSGDAWTTTTVGNADEGIAAADGLFIVAGSNSDATIFYAVTDTAADFVKMITLNYDIRYKITPLSNDTEILYVQVFKSNKTTALTNEMTVVSTTTALTIRNKGVTAFTGVSTTATKAEWDGAYLSIRTSHDASAGSDGSVWSIDGVELTGTYNSSPTVALNSPADEATGVSTTPTLNFTGTDANAETVEYQVQVDTVDTFSISTIAFVQQKLVVGTTLTLNSVPAAGNMLVAVIGTANTNAAISSITGGGVTWVAGVVKNGAPAIRIWYGLNASGAGSQNIVITFDEGGNHKVYVGEFSGVSVDSATVVDQTGTANVTNTSTPVSGSISTTNADDLIIAGAAMGAVGLSLSSGPTNSFTGFTFSSNSTTLGAYQIVTSTGSYTTSWSMSSNDGTTGAIIGFKAAQNPLLDKFSVDEDAGFTAGHPFASGATKEYIVQAGDELEPNTEYFWRVKAIDPSGTNAYGAWSSTRSFTTGSGAAGPLKGAIIVVH